ncbi:cytoplasmic protein [Bacillus canaveralius]|uniref:Cytoplasmic protein n=1 Tax=Bacillus canaveralius TaxID=1403243 RepID=A0A2N5GK19_9BACI|nr:MULTISPECIES: immunity protein YezG family protein [Bacillus]PLR81667.1 cytoplasmic protein [Bacillus canaveralius]PLR87733.1 cytoplasmic protein [Bacillus sp. V33-4]PLR89869.1 cytoplasmic protein [Bacillus canaveralius]
METKKMEQLYQQIANTLVNMIPEEWNKIYLYAELREGYKKVFFYYYPESGVEPIYSLDITEKFVVNENEFDELENDLYGFFSELQEEFKIQEQEQWTNLTFILDNTGQMKINYGYEDLSQIGPVEKQERWEAEYIK